MSPTSLKTVRIQVDAGKLEAVAYPGPTEQLAELAVQHVLDALSQLGLKPDETLEARAEEFVRAAQAGQCDEGMVLVKGQAPKPGQDGRVEWAKGLAPEEIKQVDLDANRLSNYDRPQYPVVRAEQLLAKLIAPTPGEPGRDIFGKQLPARDGKPVNLAAGPNVRFDAGEQAFYAEIDGLVKRVSNAIRVDPAMVVQNVDFATGNIRFTGEVTVRGAVLDKFSVSADQDIEVNGLVEAAQLQAGGSIHLNGGMAGKERGQLKAGEDIVARFLDQVQATASGDIVVRKEIVNCRLRANGTIRAEGGAIVGGLCAALNGVAAGTLGSDAGTTTILRVGADPALEKALKQIDDEIERAQQELVQSASALKLMSAQPGGMSPSQRETATELSFRVREAREGLTELQQKREELEKELPESTAEWVHVTHRVYPGVRIDFKRIGTSLRKEYNGPARIMPLEHEGRMRVVLAMDDGWTMPLPTYQINP